MEAEAGRLVGCFGTGTEVGRHPSGGAPRPVHRDGRPGPVRRVLPRHPVGGQVDAVVGVQVAQADRVDAEQPGVPLERPECAVTQVDDQPEPLGFQQVAGRRAVRPGKAPGTSDHGHAHAGHYPGAPSEPLGKSRPELAFQLGFGFVEGAGVGAGGQVLPAAVGDHERDVGALARRPRPWPPCRARRAGARRSRCRRRCPRPRAARGCGAPRRRGHGEPGGQHGLVVQFGDEALVDVAQPVDELAVPRLGRDDLDVRACARAGSGPPPSACRWCPGRPRSG